MTVSLIYSPLPIQLFITTEENLCSFVDWNHYAVKWKDSEIIYYNLKFRVSEQKSTLSDDNFL